jgi:6-pyruvoyltetrahydropterin/6-carboxytetrahydropterin synthase
MHRISKRFTFDAAHKLPGLPSWHKCARLHGRTYTVEVVLSAPSHSLIGPGFVADFADLNPVKSYIDSTLDHRNLNEVLPHIAPTSELLAKHLYEWCDDNLTLPVDARVDSVRVSETPSTWAEFSL